MNYKRLNLSLPSFRSYEWIRNSTYYDL